MNHIGPFRNRYFYLSNFYPTTITYENITYPTVEHAFAAAKTLDQETRKHISRLPKPAIAARAGRKLVLRDGWDEGIKLAVMEQLLELKFADKDLQKKLLATGTDQLIEYNTWHDTYWGVCTCSEHNGQGANMLGKLLMSTRSKIVNKNLEQTKIQKQKTSKNFNR